MQNRTSVLPRVGMLLLSLGCAAGAQASVVDLRTLPNNFEQAAVGGQVGFSSFFGQSVIADDVFMDEARVLVHAHGGGTVHFNILVTGDRPDFGGGLGFVPDLADIRFNSGEIISSYLAGMVEFLVTPNVAVAPGERLFLVIDVFSYPDSDEANVWATQFNAALDPYPVGEFVHFNRTTQTTFAEVNANSFDWQHRAQNNEDLAVLVSFTPEPGSFSLLSMALATAAGSWFIGRSRRA